jgi:peroxiredoxin Q/BCP
MLQAGQSAPSFDLPDADLRAVSLANERGKHHVVLYFYPKDDTSGCTLEALDFTMLADEFERADCVVFGVSRDDCVSHAAFRDKHGLSVQLLADMDGEVCEQYGVWQEKEKDGIKKMGIVRSTFVIDKAGVIRHALYGVTAKGHAAAVLELVRTLD